MTDTFFTTLAARFGDRVRRNEPLANHTTLRLGGPADIWLAATDVDELVAAVTMARQQQAPVFMLGGGANLLISDRGIRGLVIENRARRVEFPAADDGAPGQSRTVRLESGVILPNLARRCAQRGLSGLEWAVGVPGTIGGAVVNNAGAYGSDMAHNLVRAELLSPPDPPEGGEKWKLPPFGGIGGEEKSKISPSGGLGGKRLWQPVEWFEYAYRTSRLKRQPRDGTWIVLQAELTLTTAPVAEIKTTMEAFNERRKASQPPGATIGSMFKNPPGDYAGRLIEAAGLKGYRLGRARISPIHANFFQNLGGATATEVMGLIQAARRAVADRFGIELELEIEVVGEFHE